MDELESTLSRRRLLAQALAAGLTVTAGGTLIDSATASLLQRTPPRRGGRLRMSDVPISTEVLDPHAYIASMDRLRARNVCEPLAWYTRTGGVHLNLVEEFDAENKNATVWRVVLRQGVEFSNGKPLTSADVVYTLSRLLRPTARYRALFEALIDPRNTKALDRRTVRISLRRPIGDFASFLASEPLMVVPRGADAFTKPADLVGTGPFKVAEFVPGVRTVLVRNKNYWQEGKPYLDEVQIVALNPNQTDQVSAVVTGQLDLSGELTTEAQLRGALDNPSLQLFRNRAKRPATFYMRLDSPLFNDNRVREAFKLSMDRQQLLQLEFGGRGVVGNDLYGRSWPSYNNDLPQRKYDPERAAFLLRQAGREGIEVELVTGIFPLSATAYAQQARAAGIKINLKQVPRADIFNTDLYYLKVPFSETGWGAAKFEEVVPQAMVANAPYNETAWKRSTWTKKFYKAYGTADATKRNQLYREVQRTLWAQGGYMVFAWGNTYNIGNRKIRGIDVYPRALGIPLNQGRLEDIWLTS